MRDGSTQQIQPPNKYIYMRPKSRFVLLLIIVSLLAGCGTPDKLRKKHVATINRLSLLVNVMLTYDVSGSMDAVDIPLSKQLADTLQIQISQLLSEKGYQVTNRHTSVGRMTTKELFYVIQNEDERNLDVHELNVARGSFHSDRLNVQQLRSIEKAVIKKKHLNSLSEMGFDSDATLVVLVEGRTIGDGKKVAAALGNIALLTVHILAAAAGGSSSGSGLEIDDTYSIQLRLFSADRGKLLWQTDVKVNDMNDVQAKSIKEFQNRLPDK